MTELSNLLPRSLYVFLDFDGTLVSLADTPDSIVVPDELNGVLADLHQRLNGRLAIVSGREVSQIERFLPDFPGDIFGAHGAEARIDGALRRHRLVGSDIVADAQARARSLTDSDPDLLLELKDTGAVVHYRATPQKGDQVKAALQDIVDDHGDLVLHASKMAWEMRPADATKAAAVQHLMQGQPDTIRPVVIGDDVTDEEAMAVAHQMNGVCIKIGTGDTSAQHRLDGPSELHALLRIWSAGDV
ncbi:trehalose-phosphatase [Loktanella sp. SALINAS62]|uniref:trehalose-phosphatase n=1 Tax=Loktanella sp. SALINAS62 TaxID=2706124 RepID=UPI001B8CB84E|nr:trehalose-phosphatase [Loktanella sp. SALINAS62]MBS1301061.1 trehalose-phosphatase [Loktanella sp. SALINAS62]